MTNEVQMIPIDQIRILNPRHREQKKFELIVKSIQNLGLKKPIQVSVRSEEGKETGFDLVFGQGRIEAFIALGYKEIPALVVNVSKEDRLIRSLVENIARRYPARMALLHEIERLKAEGHNNTEIGKKLDISDSTVCGYLGLKNSGEERLLDAAVTGAIPLGMAMDIARAETPEMQRELLNAYQSKQLNAVSVRVVRRLMDQRRFLGKNRDTDARVQECRTSAEGLINAYKRESQRQKLMVKKAKVCDARLVFIVTAFKKLIADENFITLLRAESLSDMPKSLHDKLGNHARTHHE